MWDVGTGWSVHEFIELAAIGCSEVNWLYILLACGSSEVGIVLESAEAGTAQ